MKMQDNFFNKQSQFFFLRLFLESFLLRKEFFIDSTSTLSKGTFIISGNYRYFKSFRHFRGDQVEREVVELGTEVIDESSFFLFIS